jgi:Fe-S cluster assembly protein SufD
MSLKSAESATLNSAESLYLSATGKRAPGAPWLDTLREAAAEDFAGTGLPHRRVEAWKYTDVRALDRAGFIPAEESSRSVGASTFAPGAVDEIVILNGFVQARSLRPERFTGIEVLSLRAALTQKPDLLEETIGGARPLDRSPLYALNLSLMNDGLVLIARPGASHPRPIVVRYINDSAAPTSAHVRNVIVAGEGARLCVVEIRQENASSDFLNVVTELKLSDNSSVRHYRFDQCSDESLTVILANADLGAGTRYENVGLSRGGKLARLETQVRFSGQGGYASLGGVLAGSGKDHIDHTTIVRHDVPNCSCEEEFRAILTDKARGVFQGQISVAPDAQKTDSRMLMRGLLLSDSASMRAKPELEIYADDVKCAHGTSVGNIDEEALFYMMSRGIPEAGARALLVEAFSRDVVDIITDKTVRKEFERLLDDRLASIVGDCVS